VTTVAEGDVARKKKSDTSVAHKKRYDVPLVTETEYMFRDVEADSVEEAEEKVRELWKIGPAAATTSTLPEVVDVGPAVELESPKSKIVEG
jgi:hypothetical protein